MERRFVQLESKGGALYVDPAEIAMIESYQPDSMGGLVVLKGGGQFLLTEKGTQEALSLVLTGYK